MANHAKVITKDKLSPEEVDKFVQKINKEYFGDLFSLTLQIGVPENYGHFQWVLQYKDEKYLYLIFWLTDEEEYDEVKDEFKKVKIQNCIEFRHGHTFHFMWWIEAVFRENLGHYYKAKMFDDGVGDCELMPLSRLKSYKDYLGGNSIEKDILKRRKEFNFDPDWGVPNELVDQLQLDFEI